jgi:hypothetical protein
VKVCLLPLDERPATLRYPVLLGAIAGIEVVTPPADLLGSRRRAMDTRALGAWLVRAAKGCDAAIVSCEALAHGGLVPSRISHETVGVVTARLDALRAAKASNPRLKILGSSVISRVANDNHAGEEPDYWAVHGCALHAYSATLDRHAQGAASDRELRRATGRIPEAIRRDFHARRLRNHTVNLAAVHLAAEGVFDFLAVTSDDTSPFGLPAREKRWIAEQATTLGLGARLLMYPGADEVACALLARVVNEGRAQAPRFAVAHVAPRDADTIPPFEDVPVGESVLRQLRAAGAVHVRSAQPGDTLLALNTPIPGRGVFDPVHAATDARSRVQLTDRMAARLEAARVRGIHVAVADVAYANGADPVLIAALFQHTDLAALHGYAGWNTAGNTLGTVITQASCARLATTSARGDALRAFTFHRLIEDWGYQHLVRAELRDTWRARHGRTEPASGEIRSANAWIERRLTALAEDLPGLGQQFRVVPGSTRLPWRRTFEVDFDVETRP